MASSQIDSPPLPLRVLRASVVHLSRSSRSRFAPGKAPPSHLGDPLHVVKRVIRPVGSLAEVTGSACWGPCGAGHLCAIQEESSGYLRLTAALSPPGARHLAPGNADSSVRFTRSTVCFVDPTLSFADPSACFGDSTVRYRSFESQFC